MIVLEINNVLTKIIGTLPDNVLAQIQDTCSYSIKGAEHSVYGAETYCPFCKKQTYPLSMQEMLSSDYPNDGLNYRKCPVHGFVVPVSLWDGRKMLLDKRNMSIATGVVGRIVKIFKENNVAFKIQDTRYAPFTRRMAWYGPELRYYQKDAAEAVIKASRGIIQASMGTGKTLLLAHAASVIGVNTLVIAHTTGVFHQLYKTFSEVLKVPIGRIGDGKKEIEKITIAMPPSLTESVKVPKSKLVNGVWRKVQENKLVIKPQFKDFLVNTEALLVDECFPGKTRVFTEKGYMCISKIVNEKTPVKVWSFNGEDFELKPIARYMKHTITNDLVCITLEGNKQIKCTPNHKIYVLRDGEITKVRADELTTDMEVISMPRTSTSKDNECAKLTTDQESIILGSVLGDGSVGKSSGGCRLRMANGIKQLPYLNWKIQHLQNIVRQKPYMGISGYTGKKSICYVNSRVTPRMNHLYNITNTTVLKKALTDLTPLALAIWFCDDGANMCNASYSLSTHAYDLDGQKAICDTLAKKFGIQAKIAKDNRINKYYLRFNKDDMHKINKVIHKYVIPDMQYKLLPKYRNKYNFKAQPMFKYNTKKIVAITTSQINAPTNVYNLEVEDNHNYIVDHNVLVSNCHHISSDTVQLIANNCVNAFYRMAVSATPYRDDGTDILIEAASGKVQYRYTGTQAIKDGFLVQPTIYIVNYKQKRLPRTRTVISYDKATGAERVEEKKMTYKDAYDLVITHNDERNKLIEKIIRDRYAEGKTVLCLVRYIEHGKILLKLLKDLGKDVRYVNGEDDSKLLMQTLDDLDKKKVKVVIGTSVFNEGVDVRHLDCVINATAGDSSVNAMQIVGRALRKVPGKEHVDIYDISDYGARWFTNHSDNRKRMYRTEPGFTIQELGGE